MDNQNVEVKEDDLVAQEQNRSIFDMAKQLESGKIEPVALTKEILVKCANIYKSRGYSNGQIAEILDVDEKTIQRYINIQREENALSLDVDFQKRMVSEVVNNWRAQYQRLLKLSYSEELTPSEIMKAIYLAHQVEKDGSELLERLGYLQKVFNLNTPGF